MKLKFCDKIENIIDFLQQMIPLIMQEEKVFGCSLALIKDAETIWTKGFGKRSADSDLPVNRMLKPYIKLNENISWSLGWGLDQSENSTSFWQWGWWHGFRNFVIASKQSNNGIVIMTNSENGLNLCDKIIKLVFAESCHAFSWLDQV